MKQAGHRIIATVVSIVLYNIQIHDALNRILNTGDSPHQPLDRLFNFLTSLVVRGLSFSSAFSTPAAGAEYKATAYLEDATSSLRGVSTNADNRCNSIASFSLST
ncbi:uncharacterized protein N7529_006480 [Penicillium soppii]|jgi:hypothetical protein|uniref:uncharacterized protein n=1 Tax=Penicillium soppii TaxID=69789 RepID=UPI0025472183|nr:uncharacterized protein N7529_006480 [Penicillium soppii]KAJ5864564.1 hypothetical protein N7529_006480 [Penicillium soppii]